MCLLLIITLASSSFAPTITRETNSNTYTLNIFHLSTDGRRAYPIAGANFWNSLPIDITCLVHSCFKRHSCFVAAVTLSNL